MNKVEKMKKPLIFVTNDDGVGARGLRYAEQVALKFGRVVVIAPERPQSGMAHAITMSRPLYLRKVKEAEDLTVYACDGTPVDCVKMGFDYLFADEKPVLTISGINHGSNSAISVIYSGTMGAAIEASFYGAPSIGLSLVDPDPQADFGGAALYGERIVADVMRAGVKSPLCLNVNFPAVPADRIRGVRVCRQNRGYWKEEFFCRQDPRGRDYFWLTGNSFNEEPEATDTDEWALANDYVSVVPIQVDLTNYEQVGELKKVIR